jgi:hypothetical protein
MATVDTPQWPGHGAGTAKGARRRNVLAYIGDYLFFGGGESFAGQATVLPSLVRTLTDSAPLAGLASTLATGGWLIPQLFAANLITGLPRLKSAVLVPAIAGRVLFMLIPASLLVLAPGHPGAALAVLFGLYFLFWALDGVASVSWLDLMGRLLTPQDRARMISAGQAGGGILGIGVGLVVTVVLASARLVAPGNYALLLALGARTSAGSSGSSAATTSSAGWWSPSSPSAPGDWPCRSTCCSAGTGSALRRPRQACSPCSRSRAASPPRSPWAGSPSDGAAAP